MRNIILLLLLVAGFWQKSYSQNTLQYFINEAKHNSPLINKSKNDIKIAELDLKQIKRVLSIPEISLSGSVLFAPIVSRDNNAKQFEWISKGAVNYTGYDLASTDGGQYLAGILIKQPLFKKSEFQSFSNKADISKKINQNNIEITVHQLEQLVGYQYILCMKSKKQAKNSLSILNQVKKQIDIMQKLVDNAIYKQTDLMLLQITCKDYEIEYKTFRSDYENNLYGLNLICGINDTATVDIKETDFVLKPDIFAYSKFITTYKLDSMNYSADLKIYEQKYKPQLFLFADAGLNATYLPTLNRLGFSTGVSFSWTIFDGRQRELQQQKTNINLNTLDFKKKNFITQQHIQKNKILKQIILLEQKEKILEEQINQYKVLIDTYKKELSSGQISVMDLKKILNEFAVKKQDMILIETERQTLINSYNYWNY
ncbi:MAG: TolC family protein [Chlorobi bacterium]|nr:TolC family protein [Chlorobiota bacterium]